jgi:hypothetical protein
MSILHNLFIDGHRERLANVQRDQIASRDMGKQIGLSCRSFNKHRINPALSEANMPEAALPPNPRAKRCLGAATPSMPTRPINEFLDATIERPALD